MFYVLGIQQQMRQKKSLFSWSLHSSIGEKTRSKQTCNVISNSNDYQKQKENQVGGKESMMSSSSMNEWIKKVWNIYLCLKKEGHPVICYNIEEPERHCAK